MPPTQDRNETLHSLLREFNHAALVTQRRDHPGLNARPMAILEVSPDNDLLFLTHAASNKVSEIFGDPEFGVTLQDGTRFVSLGGKAMVLHDPDRVRALWRPDFAAWLEGPDDPHAVLLRFVPEVAEYWDMSAGNILWLMFEEARAIFTGDQVQWRENTHGEVRHAGPS